MWRYHYDPSTSLARLQQNLRDTSLVWTEMVDLGHQWSSCGCCRDEDKLWSFFWQRYTFAHSSWSSIQYPAVDLEHLYHSDIAQILMNMKGLKELTMVTHDFSSFMGTVHRSMTLPYRTLFTFPIQCNEQWDMVSSHGPRSARAIGGETDRCEAMLPSRFDFDKIGKMGKSDIQSATSEKVIRNCGLLRTVADEIEHFILKHPDFTLPRFKLKVLMRNGEKCCSLLTDDLKQYQCSAYNLENIRKSEPHNVLPETFTDDFAEALSQELLQYGRRKCGIQNLLN
jgi:hypothetical protein